MHTFADFIFGFVFLSIIFAILDETRYNRVEDNENSYIVIEVQPYPIAISYKGIYYYRSGSTNQKLTGVELENFLLHRQGATWDNLPLPSFTIDDVDEGVIKRFKKWAAKRDVLTKTLWMSQKTFL